VYAQFANASILIPDILMDFDRYWDVPGMEVPSVIEGDQGYCRFYRDNIARYANLYDGSARYNLIHPGWYQPWGGVQLNQFEEVDLDSLVIKWVTFADNAPPNRGSVPVMEIKVKDRRDETPE
jgi:hypothetical protein